MSSESEREVFDIEKLSKFDSIWFWLIQVYIFQWKSVSDSS